MSRSRSPHRHQCGASEREKAVKLALDSATSVFAQWEKELQDKNAEIADERQELACQRAKFENDINLQKAAFAEECNEAKRKLEDQRSELEEEKNRILADYASSNDIISINMGGEKVVQVKRSLLTQVQDTYLASMFSGRWEDQITRDKEGNVFFDDPPEVLMPLIDWLRACRDAAPGETLPLPSVDGRYSKPLYKMLHRMGFKPVGEPEPMEKVTKGKLTRGFQSYAYWYRAGAAEVIFKHRYSTKDGCWSAWKSYELELLKKDGDWVKITCAITDQGHHQIGVFRDEQLLQTWDAVY